MIPPRAANPPARYRFFTGIRDAAAAGRVLLYTGGNRGRKGIVALMLVLTPLCATATPPSPQQAEELTRLRHRIQSLQQQLAATRGERDQSARRLRQVDQAIHEQLQALRRLDRKLGQARRRLRQLQTRELGARRDLAQLGRQLEREARAAYLMGRQEYVKMLLNQQNPAEIQRVLVYYRYLSAARLEHIDELKRALARQRRLEQQLRQHTEQLQRLRDQQLQRKQTLETRRNERRQLLASLERKVRDQSQELRRLKEDARRLQALIDRLPGVLDEAGLPRLEARFAQYRHRLRLPLRGRITGRYGRPRGLGDLTWNGVFLSSPEGRDVVSVFRGRVAYADWLRGFGLLLILEHGDGYMSLYGHNQSLYKEVGEWVETGEVIAKSGSTGNPRQPGLYFEIRHNGQPLDPLSWCRQR